MNDRFDDSDADPPEWCAFFEREAYGRFRRWVREHLAERGLEFRIDDGVVWLPREGGANRVGLQGLAQRCHAADDEAQWPSLIAHHVDTTLGGFAEMAAMDDALGDLDAVRDKLKLRLYPRTVQDSLPEAKLVWWPVTDDLMAVLAVDLPSSVVTVSSEMRAGWSVSDEELYELARENVARLEIPTVEDLAEEGGVALRALYGDSFFVATHLLHVAHFVDPPPLGVLVAVPHRHVLLLHRIEDARVVLAINSMLTMAHQMHLEGPGSLSNQLYWWREGRLLHLPSEVSDGSLRFIPPPAFVDQVLEPLAES